MHRLRKPGPAVEGIGFRSLCAWKIRPCMMNPHPKLGPSRKGTGFFLPHSMNPPSCATSRKRYAANHRPIAAQCLRGLATDHAATTAPFFYIPPA
jgi:hypothetical protein